MPLRSTKYQKKYLSQHSAWRDRPLANLDTPEAQHLAMVIPVFDEDLSALHAQIETVSASSTAVQLIYVFNAPHYADQAAKQRTINLAQSLTDHPSITKIDAIRCTHATKNVGEARKLGTDLACHWYATGQLTTPWIANTDADASLPKDYFDPLSALNSADEKNVSAAIYPFQHQRTDDPKLQIAIDCYERHLHSYQLGLAYAKSPYAYHTIGSTIVLNANHYMQAHGFPKRDAGEDFYLLNKLAKLGHILQFKSPTVSLATRRSSRVPFGTGPALNRISELPDPINDYGLYHPELFIQLKLAIEYLETVIESAVLETDQPQQMNITFKNILHRVLTQHGLQTMVNAWRKQNTPIQQRHRQMHNTFDAFVTLKLIHAWRDEVLGSAPYHEWVAQPAHQQVYAGTRLMGE